MASSLGADRVEILPVSQLVSDLEREGSPKMGDLDLRRQGTSSQAHSAREHMLATNGSTCKFLGFQTFLFSFIPPPP